MKYLLFMIMPIHHQLSHHWAFYLKIIPHNSVKFYMDRWEGWLMTPQYLLSLQFSSLNRFRTTSNKLFWIKQNSMSELSSIWSTHSNQNAILILCQILEWWSWWHLKNKKLTAVDKTRVGYGASKLVAHAWHLNVTIILIWI